MGSSNNQRIQKHNKRLLSFKGMCMMSVIEERGKRVITNCVSIAMALQLFQTKIRRFWYQSNYIGTTRRTIISLRVVREQFVF